MAGWGDINVHTGINIDMNIIINKSDEDKSLRLVAHSPNPSNEQRYIFWEIGRFGETLPIAVNFLIIFCIFGIGYQVLGTYVHTCILYILYVPYDLYISYML